jgi:hypothetical protein
MKKAFRLSLLCLLGIFFCACSTIRMQYQGDVDTADGKTQHYVYEKSYEIPLFPTLCPVTAIFLGGACWYYLVMPTVQQGQMVTADAHTAIAKQFKSTGLKPSKESADRVSWDQKPESSSLSEVVNK